MKRKELDDHFRMIQLLHEAKELQRITMAKAEESKADVKLPKALKEAMDDINQSVAKYEKQIAETYPDIVAFISLHASGILCGSGICVAWHGVRFLNSLAVE